jgi:putative DNA primase/helicase
MLRGIRFAPAIETTEGRHLDEVMVKELTGGDTVVARRMREDYWQFKPTHHLWVATNHRPIISGTDLGIWSRIKLLPFTVTIPEDERDKLLAEKLQTEFPGVLAWAVRGCLAWQHNGLQDPQEVQQATAAYRSSMDILGDFLAEICAISPDATVPKGELYDAYLRWGKSNGERPLSKIDFGQCLQERGLTDKRAGNRRTRTWVGVRLRKPGVADNADDADKNSYIYDNNKLNNTPIIENASAMSAASASNGRIYVQLNVENFDEEWQ